MMRESRLTAGICSTTMKIAELYHKIRKEAKKQVKHRLLALLLTCCVVLLGLPTACAATPTMSILMYMCGTDLQSDCVNDLYEMCAAEIPDNVTVVVQAGGAREWDDSRLRANRINRFTIADYDFSDVEVCAWQNMGAQETLEDYLDRRVFAGAAGEDIMATPEECQGYRRYLDWYQEILPAEALAAQRP